MTENGVIQTQEKKWNKTWFSKEYNFKQIPPKDRSFEERIFGLYLPHINGLVSQKVIQGFLFDPTAHD
jgi:hypothetical protein